MLKLNTHKTCVIVMLVCLLSVFVSADWQKMAAPPDVDKKAHSHNNKPTCWLATAANMLAGAGYGTGATVQMRADDIYTDLVAHYTTANSGWADVAVAWWLTSANNIWPNNPYVTVGYEGNKTRTRWLHDPQPPGSFFPSSDDLPEYIANLLRSCNQVAISISWSYGGGHVFNAWGDENNDPNALTSNPGNVIITDSDGMEYSGDTVKYKYTLVGLGWNLTYKNNPYIKHIAWLKPIDDPNDTTLNVSQHVNSYRIVNTGVSAAGGMHHTIGANTTILSYKTTQDWDTSVEPTTYEQPTPRQHVCFAWDFTSNPVPLSQAVTVTDVMVLGHSSTNTIQVTSWTPFFTSYTPPDDPDTTVPDFDISLNTPERAGGINVVEPNMTGGHVIMAFDLYADPGGQTIITEHRLCMPYKFYQEPETHTMTLTTYRDEARWAGNFRFGHSYGPLSDDKLWDFEEWQQIEPTLESFEWAGTEIQKPIAFTGLLPYPPAEDYVADIPTACGESGTEYLPADLNYDCHVNIADFAMMAQQWLLCTDPEEQDCLAYE